MIKQKKKPTLIKQKRKIVLIDWGLILHRAIYGYKAQTKAMKETQNGFVVPANYNALRMVIGNLKMIGLDFNDEVIVCIDGRGNWRKTVDANYKGNRKDLKKDDGIDWKYWYNKFDEMVEKLKVSTPFHYFRVDTLEADDIIAVACKKFADDECIVVSSDTDFEQLVAYKNVKLFSPVSKKYKIVNNPYKVIANKIKKEATDNLITEVSNEIEYKKRQMLIDLINLPKDVEGKALEVLKTIHVKDYDLELFPYESLSDKFLEIYNSKNIITYEKCLDDHYKDMKTRQQKSRKKRKEKK